MTGRKTRGWLGAGIGETFDTPDLLKERGIEWLCDWYVDDLPCWMRTRHGPMIAMPYTVEHNDVPMWVVQNQSSGRDAETYRGDTRSDRPRTRRQPAGADLGAASPCRGRRPSRPLPVGVIDLLQDRDDTVFVTGSEIADWFVAADGTGGRDLMADD